MDEATQRRRAARRRALSHARLRRIVRRAHARRSATYRAPPCSSSSSLPGLLAHDATQPMRARRHLRASRRAAPVRPIARARRPRRCARAALRRARGRPIGRSRRSGSRRWASTRATPTGLRADPVTLVAGRDDVAPRRRRSTTSRATRPPRSSRRSTRTSPPTASRSSRRGPMRGSSRAAVAPALATTPARRRRAAARCANGCPTARDARHVAALAERDPDAAARASGQRRARDARAGAPANSVWFSARRHAPPRAAPAPPIRTFANGGIAAALAAHAGIAGAPAAAELAGDARALPRRRERVVVALDRGVATRRDVERAWAAPASRALARGRARRPSR